MDKKLKVHQVQGRFQTTTLLNNEKHIAMNSAVQKTIFAWWVMCTHLPQNIVHFTFGYRFLMLVAYDIK